MILSFCFYSLAISRPRIHKSSLEWKDSLPNPSFFKTKILESSQEGLEEISYGSNSVYAANQELEQDPGDLHVINCGDDAHKEKGSQTFSYYLYNCEFKDYQSTDYKEGGAVYIYNCGLRCTQCHFINCASSDKGGGVYHQSGRPSSKNTTEYIVEYNNCEFRGCTSAAGGGLYLYLTTEENYGYINHCQFTNNTATKFATDSEGQEDEGNANCGGGGFHLQGYHGILSSCTFSNNFGVGSNVFISALLNSGSQAIATQLINCNLSLKGSTEAKSSIYYAGYSKALKGLLIKSCILYGSVDENSYQINTNTENANSNIYIYFENTFICTGEERAVEGGFGEEVSKEGITFDCASLPTINPSITPTIDPSLPFLTCDSNKRCEFGEGNAQNTTYVKIQNTKFSDIHSDTDGGAVFLSGYNIICDQSTFERCSSNNQGGGIYLKIGLRKYNNVLNAEISNCQLNKCKAKGGAGIFAHSTVEGRLINIHKCIFNDNEVLNISDYKSTLLDTESSDINVGGGGIFLVTNGGVVENCEFKDNKGIGSDMIVYISNDISSSLRQETIIKDCKFNFEGNSASPSSFYLIRTTKSDIHVTLENCVFRGTLEKEDGIIPHFIDADELKQRLGLLVLKDVYFCGDFNEQQVFQGNVSNYIDIENSSIYYDCSNLPDDTDSGKGLSKSGKIAIGIVIPLVVIVVVVVIIIFFVIKKRNDNMAHEEPTNELSETFKSTSDFYASQGASEENPLSANFENDGNDPFMREFEESLQN
ncbi:hypothetical protein TRFO_33062 [Tritrichomonas foetus]|uniref:Right handed beta helix domain-containing protein n=1 Tax=Tritrichomonas foetus TaxID=1144522 RepID=A0A1J4JSP1_9EUKA|nr:hypothetical protein TRFO_33062 [Tritrichomonas foetus]|eukprot:OHT00277.1 hypothetical protein TRFO_33062 [Tritrichomonas foetus]